MEKTKEKIYVDDKNFKTKQNKICFASFPRSGNSMIRTIYENTTKTYTGDDMTFEETDGSYDPQGEYQNGVVYLTEIGLGKEGNSEKAFVVKSHYPHMIFKENIFKVQGCVLIVRNPFDAFDSYFDLCFTQVHNMKISKEEKEKEEMKKAYNDFINDCITWYKEYFNYFFSNIIPKIPVKVIKYEDFVLDNNKHAIDLIEFISQFNATKEYFNGFSNEDILARVKEECIKGKGSYEKNGQGVSFKSITQNYYSNEQIEKIILGLWDLLDYFGYLDDLKLLNNEYITNLIRKKSKENLENLPKDSLVGKFTDINSTTIRLMKENLENKDPLKRPFVLFNNENIGLQCNYKRLKEYYIGNVKK